MEMNHLNKIQKEKKKRVCSYSLSEEDQKIQKKDTSCWIAMAGTDEELRVGGNGSPWVSTFIFYRKV